MKKFLIIVLLFACFAVTVQAALTNGQDFYNANRRYLHSATSADPLYTFIGEIEGVFDGTGSAIMENLLFTLETSNPTSTEGRLYYNTSSNLFKFFNGSSWLNIAAESGTVSLNVAYGNGVSITVDNGAVTLAGSDAASNVLLALDQNDTDGTVAALTVDSAGDAAAIIIAQTGSGGDIEGTAGWSIDATGVGTFLSFVLENGEIISNATDDTILIDTGAEDLKIDFTTGTNTITFTANSTGATTFDIGDFVSLIGLQNLTGEAGADYTIASANSGTFNLVVAQTGTGDNELRLVSAGTAANAVAITASVAGITNTAAGDFVVVTTDDVLYTVGDDLTISGATGGVFGIAANAAAQLVTIGNETGVSALHLLAGTGDIDIQGVAASTITIGDAAQTAAITIGASTATMTDLSLGTGVGAHVIHIGDGGTASQDLRMGSASGASPVALKSGTGDITLTSTDQIALTVATNATDNIVLTNTASTDVDAISLVSTAGGIQHASNNVASTWTHTANGAADDLSFIVAGAFDGSLVLTSSGTAGNAIDIDTTAGGIDIDMAGGAAGEDFSIVTATSIDFQPSEAQPGQFKVVAGGTNAGDVIELESTDGRIILDANGGSNGDIELNSADDVVITSAGKVTITNTEAVTVSGALTVTGATTTGGFVQVDQLVTDAANYQVTAANSGKIHLIGVLTQNTTIKLPAEADGLNYEFWFSGAAADSDDHNITSEDTAAPFIGGVVWLDSADAVASVYSDGVAGASGNYILTMPNMAGGTRVKITCDGTNWYVTGVVVSDTTPTMTGA